MRSAALKLNSQQILGIGFGVAAFLHSPETPHAPAKLVVGAGTGLLVWLFSKATGEIVSRTQKAHREKMREEFRQFSKTLKELKPSTPRPAAKTGLKTANKKTAPRLQGAATDARSSAKIKLTPEQAAPLFHQLRGTAQNAMIMILAQAAIASGTYHWGRPYIAREVVSISSRLSPR